MSALTRFDFATEFADDGRVAFAPAPTRRTLSTHEIDALTARAFADGEQSALARAQAAQADALRRLAVAADQALSSLSQAVHEHRRGSAELALAAARRIADAALDRFPEAPLLLALDALSREVEAAPRLTVRISAPNSEHEAVSALVESAAATAGFAGRLSVSLDADAPPGSFSFDWGDGRAAFDPETAAARVAEALSGALAAEGLHAEAPPPHSPGEMS